MSKAKRSRTSPRPSSPGSSQIIQALSNDTWSHIISFMASSNAWKSAVDIANMAKTCRAWNAIPLWTYYTQTFRIFPFQTMPARVKFLMKAASSHKGFVNQKTAAEHLKLTAANLKDVPHQTLRLGMGRKMYLYEVGDVLRVATDRFQTVQAMEKHFLKCHQTKMRRLQNQEAKDQRRENVRALLRNLNADFIKYTNVKEIDEYVEKNRGSLDEVRAVIKVLKQKYDEEQARIRSINRQREQYRSKVLNLSRKSGRFGNLLLAKLFRHQRRRFSKNNIPQFLHFSPNDSSMVPFLHIPFILT